MVCIGTFARIANGYSGRLRTLSIDAELAIVSADPSDVANAPDYRVHLAGADGPEIGAGWKRTGRKNGDYVSLTIDDPQFLHPIRARLIEAEGTESVFHLQWIRPSKSVLDPMRA